MSLLAGIKFVKKTPAPAVSPGGGRSEAGDWTSGCVSGADEKAKSGDGTQQESKRHKESKKHKGGKKHKRDRKDKFYSGNAKVRNCSTSLIFLNCEVVVHETYFITHKDVIRALVRHMGHGGNSSLLSE